VCGKGPTGLIASLMPAVVDLPQDRRGWSFA
jgi:hypothetical protein